MCKCVAQRSNVVAGDQQNVAVQQFTRKVDGFVGWNKNDLKDRMLVIAIKSSHRIYVGQVKKERHGSLWLILRWGLVSNVQSDYFRDRHQDSLIYGTSHYKKISQASIVKRIITHSTGAEKTGANAEVTRTSVAMNLKDACIAWYRWVCTS